MIKKLLIVLGFVIIIVGVSIGIYFAITPSPNPPGFAVTEGKKYYIHELRNGLYTYEDETAINLATADSSYCIFENNFRTFKIYFTSGPKATFDFVVTKLKRGKKSFRATVQHIFDGTVISYDVSTTTTKIVLKTEISYSVIVGTEENPTAHPQTISRPDITAISFARSTPAYITEVP